MRKFFILAAALAATTLRAVAATAAASNPYSDVQAVRNAWSGVHYVQLVEHFGTGTIATVEYVPTGQPPITMASTNGNGALLDAMTMPGGDSRADLRQLFTITSLGADRSDGNILRGYKLAALNGSGTETLWVNEQNLPVKAHIEVNGQTADVLYGNYNVPLLFADH